MDASVATPRAAGRFATAALFASLVTGYAVFTAIESIEPTLLPVLLAAHDATSAQVGFIVGSLAAVLNVVLAPLVSYASDRTRSPLGRRGVWMLASAPAAGLFLALIPLVPNHADLLAWAVRPFGMPPALVAIGLVVALFQCANCVVSTLTFCLFRDVVPGHLFGRFNAAIRIAGAAGGLLFQLVILPRAGDDPAGQPMRLVFLLGGLALAASVFTIVIPARRKDAAAPIAPPAASPAHAVADFFATSFRPAPYRWMYAARALIFAGVAAPAPLLVLYATDELGLSLRQLGEINQWPLWIGLACGVPFGWAVDRLGAGRLLVPALGAIALVSFAAWLAPRNAAGLLAYTAGLGVLQILVLIAVGVWQRDVFEPARFGQLAAANGLVGALALAVLSPICGWLCDAFHTRAVAFVWTGGACLLALAATRLATRAARAQTSITS